MKNSGNTGYDQHYNAQAVVTQESRFILATSLSNHPNDKWEAAPTLDALAAEIGTAQKVANDDGYYSASNIDAAEKRGIEPYIATGRGAHYLRSKTYSPIFQANPAQMPIQENRWLTNWLPKSVSRFIDCVNLRLNRCLASSKKF